MADAGLFVGWGEVVRGRETEAVEVFNETLAYYSRYGQPIISDLRGRYAGYDWPQLSIHRADLHKVLLDAVHERLGADASWRAPR